MELDPKQIEAINACLDSTKRIVAVTGAAGTGKTTIIRNVCDKLKEQDIYFAVAAPTGKAARRVTQATGYNAVTLHRLLEYPRPGEIDEKTGKPLEPGFPRRDYRNPLLQQVIIIDEYAMVSEELDRNLIDALSPGARILVFGDVNQLPPIEEYRQPTKDTPFERHLRRTCVELSHVYRQEEGGGILTAANNIRRGMVPHRADDFVIRMSGQLITELKSYVQECESKGISFKTINNQIISPSRTKSWIATQKLNRMLQDLLNPDNHIACDMPRQKWDKEPLRVRLGDKVVCTENLYDMRDFDDRYADSSKSEYIPAPDSKTMLNGETGIVTDIMPDGSMQIDFGDRTVEMPHEYVEYSMRHDNYFPVFPGRSIDLAYALTTHKCQGSEFDHVVYLMTNSLFFMLNRKNFYTAVTRARKHVLVLTEPRALPMGLKQERK